jgi:hypothetical protein
MTLKNIKHVLLLVKLDDGRVLQSALSKETEQALLPIITSLEGGKLPLNEKDFSNIIDLEEIT